MTSTFDGLRKWSTKLIEKMGSLMLPGMSYKHDQYETELETFIERAIAKMNSMVDIDRKKDLEIMINNIRIIHATFKKIVGSTSSGTSLIKKTRKTSAYNNFIRENFSKIKAQHPEWDNTSVMKYVVQMWRAQKATMVTQSGGLMVDDMEEDYEDEYYDGGEYIEQSGGSKKANSVEEWKKRMRSYNL
jgi:hypothetical protein